jgi:hypothetical protein
MTVSATPAELMTSSLLEVFGERDESRRRDAISRTFAEGVVFHDEAGSITGYDALNAKVTALLGGAPSEWAFQLTTPAAEVAELGRVTWGFGPKGSPVVRGMDIGIVGDGRITSMYTIVDAAPGQ